MKKTGRKQSNQLYDLCANEYGIRKEDFGALLVFQNNGELSVVYVSLRLLTNGL